MHAVGQRNEHAIAGSRRFSFTASHIDIAAIPPSRANETAVLLFHGQELGQRGFQAEVAGVSGVDAPHKGLNQTIKGLSAKPSSNKRG